MKKTLFVLSVAILLGFNTVTLVFCDEMPDGLSLYVGALKNRGNNYEIFHSLRLKFELEQIIPKKSPEEIKAFAEELSAEVKEGLRHDPVRAAHSGNVERIIASLNEQLNKPLPKQMFRVLLRTEPRQRRILSILINEQNPNDKSWEQKVNVIEESISAKQTTSAIYFQQQQLVDVSSTSSAFDVYLNMGRLQGEDIGWVEFFLRQDANSSKYEFSEELIDKIRKELDKRQSAGKETLKVTGTVWYDENINKSLAYVLESEKNGIVVERYWIDVSRGYICPLIQFYDAKGILNKEYRASEYFLDEKSGLWFPHLYIENISGEKNDTWDCKKFHIDSDATKINEPINDGEFAIDVLDGVTVQDKRKKSTVSYKSKGKGTLSLVSGGLDLDKMDWLQKEEDSVPLPQNTRGNLVQVILCIAGIVLIIIAFLIKRGKHLPLILLPLLLFMGCNAQPDIPQGKVSVEPAVLDFGQKRPADSPVQVEFKLHNNTDKPLTITDISSGCGCTAMEYPKEPIAPKATVAVPVKINLLGRFGDFTNKIKVKTDADETYEVDVKGKIVNDLWITESSLRCTSEGGQPAKGLLEVHTVDYHDVKFDFTGIDKRLTVKELERNTKDGETVIKFDVAVDAKDDKDISLTLTSADSKIAPLTVPVYCYSDKAPTLAPVLQTKTLALGTVTGDRHEVSVYGDTDLIAVIKQAEFIGSPEGVAVEILPSDSSNALHLSFRFSGAENQAAEQTVNGNVKLTTAGKREWSLQYSFSATLPFD
ncbi:hypothetical protein FACS189419_08860 [Planctomycetales bacterium]|nr:hypothetical protein FACS189419_08860 [Planctomycetales bacterium]